MARPTPRLLAACGPSDAELLARFADHHDTGAFELLVWRHAPLVLRAGRAVLRDRHAAEDCAQAVFLALARQANSVRADTLPGWLFRVARRVAAQAARREPPPPAPIDPDHVPTPTAESGPDPVEVRALHDEPARLPEAYRAPVLLCFFEGLTHAEAARRLGWPVGTVAGRVARAKTTLGVRLARRGLAPALLVVAIETVSPTFAGTTAEAAVAFVTGGPVSVSTTIADLATHEVRRATMTKTMRFAAASVVCGAIALGFGVAWGSDTPAQPPASPIPQPPAPAQPAPAPPKAVVGKAFAVAPVTTDLQRRLLGGKTTSRAVVFVDVAALFKDRKALDLDALELQPIRKALAGYGPERGQSVAHPVFHHPPLPGLPKKEIELLEFALDGVIGRAGFVPAVTQTNYHNIEFSLTDYAGPLGDPAGADAAEPAVGDERVKAYPVRTPLSRVLAGQVAGVVDVRTRIDGRAGAGLPEGLDESARSALRALKLPPRSRVVIYFVLSERDDGSIDRLRAIARGWTERENLELQYFRMG
ncbi:sigma-70 family RNA polymerase sigma factor [bacterium]|nr:sigma-70 family RNA polymerase sigma factor [bacterium]